MSEEIVWLRHNRIDLALHVLRGRQAEAEPSPTLLLLHGLGERSPETVPQWAKPWPGAVAALDFTGHGLSTMPRGGGYSAEILLADADHALAELGEVTVVGRGLGAYVALQLAGSRAGQVHGAVLADGPGLYGGSVGPTSQSYFTLAPRTSTPDPYALVELGRDVRPPDYATLFVRLAVEGSGLDEPICVVATVRPPWLEAVTREVGVVEATLSEALQIYASRQLT